MYIFYSGRGRYASTNLCSMLPLSTGQSHYKSAPYTLRLLFYEGDAWSALLYHLDVTNFFLRVIMHLTNSHDTALSLAKLLHLMPCEGLSDLKKNEKKDIHLVTISLTLGYWWTSPWSLFEWCSPASLESRSLLAYWFLHSEPFPVITGNMQSREYETRIKRFDDF